METFKLSEDCKTLIKYNGLDTVVEIPEGVEKIASFAFNRCESIKTVLLPSSIKEICSKAFNECESLSEISIPSSVKEIQKEAIVDCRSLIHLSVDKNNEVYDSRDNCNAIIETASDTIIIGCSSTYFPKSVTAIGACAFSYCEGLNEIKIPSNILTIEWAAFMHCDSLKKVIYEKVNDYILFEPFIKCPNLREMVVPDSYDPIETRNDEEIESKYFDVLIDLKSSESRSFKKPIYNKHVFILLPNSFVGEFFVPDGITHIEPLAFMGCTNLTRVYLPKSVKSIGDLAFNDCENLEYISIDSNINNLKFGYNIFYNCGSLQTTFVWNNILIRVNTKEKRYVVDDNVTLIEMNAFQKCTQLESVTIPESVKSINSGAFEDCVNLESIVIPNSVIDVGESLFKGCKKIRQIELPINLTSIKMLTFSGCENLELISIPEKTESIGYKAFEDCRSIKTIRIPKSVTRIGDFAFCNCTALETVIFEWDSSLIEIGESAFKGCKSLKGIHLPDGVKQIKNNTFEDCESLRYIRVPSSIQSISKLAFKGCYNIQNAVMSKEWDNKRSALGLPPGPTRYVGYGPYDPEDHVQRDASKMIYTYGRFTPCPYCGNKGTSTYTDGTAQCDKCRRWFRYSY